MTFDNVPMVYVFIIQVILSFLQYVYGMAGIGKTSVLAEFIKLYHFAFPSIFWIRGHNEITLASGIWKLVS